MKVKGKFETQVVHVGLSADLPPAYGGPEQKYELADRFAHPSLTHVRYEKHSLEFEMEETSDELVRTADRVRCYRLVSLMPETALSEVEEVLLETYEHYIGLANVARRTGMSLPAPKLLPAKVTKRITT